MTVLFVLASSADAQLQQPFVYTTGGAIAIRDDATGALAPTPASPLAVLGFPAVLDAKGRFLFAGGNNSIHMYQVDSVTGSYTEVPASFTCTGAPLGATCQPPASVVLNTGAQATFTVTVVTSGGAMGAPNTASRRSPPTTVSPNPFAAALNVLFFILVLRLYREWGGSTYANGLNASRWKIAYAVAVLLFIPLIFATNGCGGAAANAPATQKSSIVTPSGTSTLVITPTATNASGKALQLPLIQLTLVVN
ncbi:MAG TPA: hypothetical protein VH140_13590 [Candidatus Acidoferrum sp.]|nr:hypothetical protein [Candidatus Acidoferrum sp.]